MERTALFTSHRVRILSAAVALALGLGVSTSLADGTAPLVPGSTEDFEGGGLGYVLGGSFGAGGDTDYWEVIPNDGTRVNATTITTGGIFGSAVPVGGSVLAGDDTNANGTSPVTVTFNSVVVTGLVNLSANVLLAASNPTQGASNRGFEGTDFVEIQVSYDGGAFQQLAIYEEDPSFNGGLNSFLSQDTDADGLGDAGSGTGATAIEQGFKNFSHPLSQANTVQIRIRVAGEATGEYVAIDNFRICGEVPTTDPPVLANIEGTAIDYSEGDPATQVTNTITISDSDSTNLSGATVQISSNNTPSEDVLAATGSGGITVGAYNSATGTLTLSGTASLADYQTTLRSVTYQNTNILNPNTAQRTVTFQVTDDTPDFNDSNLAMRNINVDNSIQVFPIPHTESFDDGLGTGDRYEVIGGFDVAQSDFFAQIPASDAGVRFSVPVAGVVGTGFFGGEDIDQNGLADGGKVVVCLDASGLGNLSVDVLLAAVSTNPFESADGLWVEYQFGGGSWIELIAFRPVSGGGDLAIDTDADGVGDGTALTALLTNYNLPILDTGTDLKVRVRAQSSTTSEEIAFDELTVSGSDVGFPPVLSNIDPGPLGYVEGDGAVVISSTATITDGDHTAMASATVEVSNNYVNGEDVLNFVDTATIVGNFSAATGTLTLSGSDTIANYEAALQSVTYENTNLTNPNENDRTVTFRVNDSVSFSNAEQSTIQVFDVVAVQEAPYCESFETDGLGTRYSANSFNIAGDFFEMAAANFGGLSGINADGAFAFGGKDTDADGNPVHFIEIAFDTDGGSNLELDLKLAAVLNQFETTDTIVIEADADGGGFAILDTFAGTGINTSLTNGADILGPDYTDLSYSLPVAAETRIRISMNTNASLEETAVDNICISGDFGPEMDVQGMTVSIPGDGSNTPSASDDTDFGSVECGIDSDVAHTFTILNTANADLNLTGTPLVALSGSSDFSATSQPATNPISGPDGSTTFEITFSPTAVGLKTATVSIGNDDEDEDPYVFNIEGTGTDTTPPEITLTGANPQTIECTSSYIELGATASDACDGDLTGSIIIDASGVDPSTPGSYLVTYDVMDAAGNAADQVTRTVNVVDTTPPEITLLGDNPQVIQCGAGYVELSATAGDSCDGDLTGSIVIDASAVNTSMVGSYPVTYNVMDASGNAASEMTRTVLVIDTLPPIITLIGANPQTIECGASYVELGASALDLCDGILTGSIVIDSSGVDTSTPGSYSVTYDVMDAAGNNALQVTRTVMVEDTTGPEISLVGDNPQTIECGSPYVELGATAADVCDGVLTGSIVVDASGVNTSIPGTYMVTYNVSDAAGNAAAEVKRSVSVVDTTPPEITLNGSASLTLECGIDTYTELGATATDACDGSVSVIVGGQTVDADTLGTYVVTYDATDAAGNTAQETRTVMVVDTTKPVITLNGASSITLECLVDTYTELGATASDECDPSVVVVIGGDTVDTSTSGTYHVTYDATDDSGNMANQVVRTVVVQDSTPPEVTILAPASGFVEAIGNPIFFAADIVEQCGLQDAFWEFLDFEGQVTMVDATVSSLGGGIFGVEDLITFNEAGIYAITLVAIDDAGNRTEVSVVTDIDDDELPAFVIIYDPRGGFVTGGGWIWSPEGAFHPYLAEFTPVSGKATFGFVAKFKKGISVPVGKTEFHFNAGDLSFKSSSYQWLVIAGKRAQYKGWGTINGEGNYNFMLAAIDGDLNGGDGLDRFRIKISHEVTGELIYDNQVGADEDDDLDDATIIQGGSIVIHKKKK